MRLPIGILVAAFTSMAASGAVKAPDAAALDATREEVRAILANDFTALNAGRVALVDVADHAASLSAAENSPARLRVLQEGAFNLYREAGALGRAAERRVPFWINLGSDAEFEFVACPAGSFTMGCDGDRASPAFRHKVNLPRPFWIAKFPAKRANTKIWSRLSKTAPATTAVTRSTRRSLKPNWVGKPMKTLIPAS